jgi:hypothetical protein
MVLGGQQESIEIRTVRAGEVDDEALVGRGTLAFQSDPPEFVREMGWSSKAFEFRIVDGLFWFYNPVPAKPGWLGTKLEDFADAAGGDPTGNVDADTVLMVVVDAVTQVREVRPNDATCGTTWSLIVRGDDLAPIVTTGGAMRRLLPEGTTTGKSAAVSLEVDRDGMVREIRADLDDWGAAVTEKLEARMSSMSFNFSIEDFDVPVSVEAPCADPSPHQKAGEPPSLVCQ